MTRTKIRKSLRTKKTRLARMTMKRTPQTRATSRTPAKKRAAMSRARRPSLKKASPGTNWTSRRLKRTASSGRRHRIICLPRVARVSKISGLEVRHAEDEEFGFG